MLLLFDGPGTGAEGGSAPRTLIEDDSRIGLERHQLAGEPGRVHRECCLTENNW